MASRVDLVKRIESLEARMSSFEEGRPAGKQAEYLKAKMKQDGQLTWSQVRVDPEGKELFSYQQVFYDYARRMAKKEKWVELEIGHGRGVRRAWMPKGKTAKDFDWVPKKVEKEGD